VWCEDSTTETCTMHQSMKMPFSGGSWIKSSPRGVSLEKDHPDPCCVVGNENHSSKKRGIMSMKNCRQSPVVSQSAIDKLIPVVLVVVVVLTNYCSSDCGCRCTGIRRSVSGTCCTVDNGGIWISNAVVRAAHFKCGRGFKNGTQK
jgi:hypothetical protein